MAYLRAWKSAAPLKPPKPTVVGHYSQDLRAWKSAAPLKLGVIDRVTKALSESPRLEKRGPVEANQTRAARLGD